MSDTAKKLMLTQMAKTLGLNRYNITEDETGIYLKQQSVNGNADISIKKSSVGEYFTCYCEHEGQHSRGYVTV